MVNVTIQDTMSEHALRKGKHQRRAIQPRVRQVVAEGVQVVVEGVPVVVEVVPVLVEALEEVLGVDNVVEVALMEALEGVLVVVVEVVPVVVGEDGGLITGRRLVTCIIQMVDKL